MAFASSSIMAGRSFFLNESMVSIKFGLGVGISRMYLIMHFRTEIRDQELTCLRGRKYLDAMCVYFWATTPVLVSVLTFTTYIMLGNQLRAAQVSFGCINLYVSFRYSFI